MEITIPSYIAFIFIGLAIYVFAFVYYHSSKETYITTRIIVFIAFYLAYSTFLLLPIDIYYTKKIDEEGEELYESQKKLIYLIW